MLTEFKIVVISNDDKVDKYYYNPLLLTYAPITFIIDPTLTLLVIN